MRLRTPLGMEVLPVQSLCPFSTMSKFFVDSKFWVLDFFVKNGLLSNNVTYATMVTSTFNFEKIIKLQTNEWLERILSIQCEDSPNTTLTYIQVVFSYFFTLTIILFVDNKPTLPNLILSQYSKSKGFIYHQNC